MNSTSAVRFLEFFTLSPGAGSFSVKPPIIRLSPELVRTRVEISRLLIIGVCSLPWGMNRELMAASTCRVMWPSSRMLGVISSESVTSSYLVLVSK
jgi:hypothetical protein